jgi:hypothetical protein
VRHPCFGAGEATQDGDGALDGLHVAHVDAR